MNQIVMLNLSSDEELSITIWFINSVLSRWNNEKYGFIFNWYGFFFFGYRSVREMYVCGCYSRQKQCTATRVDREKCRL